MSSSWRPFQTQPHATLPLLFIQHEFGPTTYSIWLTDLADVWVEFLDRRGIIKRAFDIDTSIDPSEDAQQLRMLLQSVKDAVEQGDKSTVDISSSNSGKQLTISTLTPLPGSLKPLKWSVELSRASRTLLTGRLILPLLEQQSQAQAEKDALMQIIKEKDNVISKFINHMQRDGNDLSKIFPGAPSFNQKNSGIPTQAFARSAKGLAEFNERQWQSHLTQDRLSNGESYDLASGMRSISTANTADLAKCYENVANDSWWDSLGDTQFQTSFIAPERPQSMAAGNEVSGVSTSASEFQRQSTPPNGNRRIYNSLVGGESSQRPIRETETTSNDSTTDESDNDTQTSTSKLQVSSPGSGKPFRRTTHPTKGVETPKSSVGTPNPLNTGSPSRAINPPSGRDPNDIEETASSDASVADPENDCMPTHRSSEIGAHASDPPTRGTRSKLGKIGGKGKTLAAGNPRAENAPTNSEMTAESSPVIKGLRNDTRTSPSIKVERRGRSEVRPKSPSPPRETSEERANSKREQLKRELEAKGHAIKKKRKF